MGCGIFANRSEQVTNDAACIDCKQSPSRYFRVPSETSNHIPATSPMMKTPQSVLVPCTSWVLAVVALITSTTPATPANPIRKKPTKPRMPATLSLMAYPPQQIESRRGHSNHSHSALFDANFSWGGRPFCPTVPRNNRQGRSFKPIVQCSAGPFPKSSKPPRPRNPEKSSVPIREPQTMSLRSCHS